VSADAGSCGRRFEAKGEEGPLLWHASERGLGQGPRLSCLRAWPDSEIHTETQHFTETRDKVKYQGKVTGGQYQTLSLTSIMSMSERTRGYATAPADTPASSSRPPNTAESGVGVNDAAAEPDAATAGTSSL